MIACKMGYERRFLTRRKLNHLNGLILLKKDLKSLYFFENKDLRIDRKFCFLIIFYFNLFN